MAALGCGVLSSPRHLLELHCPLAAGWRLGPDHRCTARQSPRGRTYDRYLGRAGAPARSLHRGQQLPGYGRSRWGLNEQDRRGGGHHWPGRPSGPHAGSAHDNRLCPVFLSGAITGCIREKNSLNSFNVIWVVQMGFEKYFASLRGQITGLFRAIPCPMRGAFRDRHGRWVRDAVDANALLTNSADADGEVVWS
jgi:hypothetical protein